MDVGNLPMNNSFICKKGRASIKRGCQGLGGRGNKKKRGQGENNVKQRTGKIFLN